MGANLTNPVPIFIDLDGNPLNGGFIYVGVADTDPMTNPVSVYQDIARTVAMAQPLRTIDGMVAVNGKAKQVFVGANSFSLAVFDKQGRLVISLPHGEDGVLISLGAPDGVTLVGGAPRVANSIADLRTFPKTANPAAIVTSYWGDGNGGGGIYRLDLTDTTSADNGGTIIVAADGGRWKLSQQSPVSVKQFGAKGDGTTDDTDRFKLALAWAASLGGAQVFVPFGTYVLTDFVIDSQSVLFWGETSGYSYADIESSVRFVPGAAAKFVARLKGTADGVTISAAAYSGFKNVQFLFTSGACQYGLFIDSDNTVCENVTFEGFPYGCVMADQVNSNKFRNCSFVLNTHVGFAVTEWQAAPYLYPGITVTSVTNTKFSMEGCNFRQNNFGIVIRSALGGVFEGCVIESNDQAGLYIYRPDNSTVRQLTFRNCWFENNYQEYTSGSTTYSITGNRMFLIGGDSTYIAWTSANQAGYQIVIDSQTHYGGGADTFVFDFCQIAADTPAQKGVRILSGFKFDFNRAWLTGGDVDNFIFIDYTAQAVHWIDPLAANNPYGLVPSLTNGFGAATGSNSIYLRSGTTFRPGELGAVYPQLGAYGGPIHFLGQVDGDPRNADARMFDDYFETLFPGLWRTDGANPFNVLSETSYFTKIGRFVKIQCRAVLQVNAATASQQTLYLAGGLPQGAESAGMLVGQILVLAGSGATPTVNNGRTIAITNTTSTISGVDPVFPALTLGHQYTITLDASYVTKT